jgi:hypothetical protein
MSSRLATPGAIAAFSGLVALAVLVPLSRAPGLTGEEAAFLRPLVAAPERTAPDLAVPPPPLAAALVRAAARVAAPLGPTAAARLPTALAGALLAALVSLLAGALAGRLAAALAPALLLSAPRLLDLFLHAGPRPLGATLAFAAALAYWFSSIARASPSPRRQAEPGSSASRTALRRVQSGIAAGVLFGLALSAQLEVAPLLAVLAAHAALVRVLRHLRPPPGLPRGPHEGGASHAGGASPRRLVADEDSAADLEPPAPLEASLRGVPVAVAALAVVGPLVALALWPWLWPDPLHRLLAAAGPAFLGPRPRWGAPLLTTALALPAALVVAGGAGVLHAAARLGRAVRGAPGLSDELFLLLGLAWPFAAAQLGVGGSAPGLAGWLAALPFLAVLAARATVAAARAAWPGRANALAAVAGALAVAGGVVATAHAWPTPGAAWGELVGGAPGAASLGLPRQDGEAAAALLDTVASRAPPGARVHLAGLEPHTLTVYRALGRLRPDLLPAATADEADVAVVPLTGGSRAAEYQVWAAFGTATPAEGTFLDEVPLAWVYARPGAWR